MGRRWARTILAVDGVGCAAAAAVVAGSERVVALYDPSLRSRWPVAAALGATSGVLLSGARSPAPGDRDLERAAVINAGWVVACCAGLRGRASRPGTAVLAATAGLDGAAAIFQLALRSRDDRD